MIPKSIPKKPEHEGRLKMMTGEKVDVYVGSGASAKKFPRLPVLLMSHYSEYFASFFKVKVEKGKVRRLDLPKDKAEDFEKLVDYILLGEILTSIEVIESRNSSEKQQVVKRCMEFLVHADSYGLGAVSDLVYEPLKKVLLKTYPCQHELLGAIQIELVFRIAPRGSAVRSLIAQAVLSDNDVNGISRFEKQVLDVDGFAFELLKDIRISKTSLEWKDSLCPVTGYPARKD